MAVPWNLIGAGVGALGGLFGRDSNPTTNTSSQYSSSTSSQNQSTWNPHQYAHPFYGWAAEQGGHMMQNPVPYFPGQGYVGPSAPTQMGVAAQMGASQAGLGAAQNLMGNAQASSPYYQQGANLGMQGLGHYGQAAGTYGQAAGMGQGVANQFGQSANLANQAIGGQQGLNQTSLGNYNFLSGAADVANNPYVQGQISANERSVMDNLVNKVMPQVNQGAQQVNALGSGRHGMMQGQAIGDAAKGLANTNASTMLNAYGQGLGAQQSALGATGQMLQNQLAPAQSAGYAANQRLAGMGALGQAAGYQNAAGQQYGQAMNQAGQAGNLMQQGNRDYLQNIQGAQGVANNAISGMMGAGQSVEGYQQSALQDAMNRFNHQYQEPMQRMQIAQMMQQMFSPMGTQYGSSAGYTAGSGQNTMPNPNYQSPFAAALGGGMVGWGLGNSWGNQQQATPAESEMVLRNTGALPWWATMQ